MMWLVRIGLFCDLVGAALLGYGLVTSKRKAIQREVSYYADCLDESTPGVADRLRQSRSAVTGLGLLFFGFLLQLVSTWSEGAEPQFVSASGGGHPVGLWFSGVGLALGLVAALLLLKSLFITDEEIARLSELPLGESSTNLTITGDHTPRPVALVIPEAADEYTARFIAARRDERTRGRRALALLVAAFVLQLAGIVLGVALPN